MLRFIGHNTVGVKFTISRYQDEFGDIYIILNNILYKKVFISDSTCDGVIYRKLVTKEEGVQYYRYIQKLPVLNEIIDSATLFLNIEFIANLNYYD